MGPLTPTPRRYRRRGWCSRIPSTRGCHRRSEPHPRPTTDARDGTHTRGGDRTPGPHPAPETGGSGWNPQAPRTPCGHVTRTPAPHPAAHGRDAGRDPWAHTRGCDRSPVTTPRPPQVIGWDHRDSHEGRGQDAGPNPAAHGTDAGRHVRDPHQDGQDAGSPPRGRGRRLRTGPRGLGDPDPRPLPAKPLPVSLGPATHHPAAPLRALRGTAAWTSARSAYTTPGPTRGR